MSVAKRRGRRAKIEVIADEMSTLTQLDRQLRRSQNSVQILRGLLPLHCKGAKSTCVKAVGNAAPFAIERGFGQADAAKQKTAVFDQFDFIEIAVQVRTGTLVGEVHRHKVNRKHHNQASDSGPRDPQLVTVGVSLSFHLVGS